jgi:hypothetical protein
MRAIRAIPWPQTTNRLAPRRRATQAGTAAMALAALALLAAGCGGGSPSAGVVHLGTGTAANTSSAGSGSASSSAGAPDSQAVAYAACMRTHGVADFPDPQVSTSGAEVKVAVRVTPAITGNPHFKPAQQACGKLLPGGGPGSGPSHQISPQEQSQYLKAAACIRTHGIPNFPDPTFSGGGVHVSQKGINPHSPQVRAAEEACQSLIPGGLHGNR